MRWVQLRIGARTEMMHQLGVSKAPRPLSLPEIRRRSGHARAHRAFEVHSAARVYASFARPAIIKAKA